MNRNLVIDRGFTTNITYHLVTGDVPCSGIAQSGDMIVFLDDSGPLRVRGSLLNETRRDFFLNGELIASA